MKIDIEKLKINLKKYIDKTGTKDQFKAKQFKDIGPGGFKCSCCNMSRGKLKNSYAGKDNSLNRIARSRLKQELHKELRGEIE